LGIKVKNISGITSLEWCPTMVGVIIDNGHSIGWVVIIKQLAMTR